MAAVASRTDRLTGRLAERELDALLVTEPLDVRYLSGFTGDNALVVVGPDARVFVTDFRYVEQAAHQVRGFDRREGSRDLLDAVGPALPDRPTLRLGFDDERMSVRTHARLGELLGAGVELVGAGGVVGALRAVKAPDELERIAAAAALADEALGEVLGTGLAGRAERDVALALELAMRRRGAEALSFPPIVASGPHGALPHAEPRPVIIESGCLVTVDWGAQLDGYCSDCTRTVACGTPGGEAREIHALVLAAQQEAVAAVGAGRGGRELDAVARDRIVAAGYGERFGHGLGHGVGLEVHEAPRLSRLSEDTLLAGNVVSVEPGVYLPGRLGVRIEDLVVVRDGGSDVLTHVDRGLEPF